MVEEAKKTGKIAFIQYNQVIVKDPTNEQMSKNKAKTNETYKQTKDQPSETKNKSDTEKRKRSISGSPKTCCTPESKFSKVSPFDTLRDRSNSFPGKTKN